MPVAQKTSRRFGLEDLAPLEDLFEQATAVVGMGQVHRGARDPSIIGLRHDVDRDLEATLSFAAWEAERGYRATYFLLPTAAYWHGGREGELSIYERPNWPKPSRELAEAVKVLAGLGHEIGFHNNALAAALASGEGTDPGKILRHELKALRSLGVEVKGVAAHGDPACWDKAGAGRVCLFANYEMFLECPAPVRGEPDRRIVSRLGELDLEPVSLAEYGLDYESFYLPRSVLISDSRCVKRLAFYGGELDPLEGDGAWDDLELPREGQLHALLHPEWWRL